MDCLQGLLATIRTEVKIQLHLTPIMFCVFYKGKHKDYGSTVLKVRQRKIWWAKDVNSDL